MEPNQQPVPSVVPTPPVQTSAETTPPPIENDPTPKRLKLIILGIVVVLLTIGIPMGVMLLGKKTPEPVAKTTVSTPTPTPDPTANWKTFTNNRYSYSIKYPDNLTPIVRPSDNSPDSDVTFISSSSSLLDRITVGSQKVGDFDVFELTFNYSKLKVGESNKLGESTTITITRLNDIQFSGKSAKVYEVKTDSKGGGLIRSGIEKLVFLEGKGNKYFFITLDTNLNVFNNMLSTFKFLDETQTGNSFQIPELGIKITAHDSSLNDLIYTYDPKTQTAYFSTTSLSALDERTASGKTYCSSQEGPIGLIAKDTTSPEGLGSGPQKENIKKLGSYYYSFLQPQATCSDDINVQTMQTSQISALKQAFSTVELAK